MTFVETTENQATRAIYTPDAFGRLIGPVTGTTPNSPNDLQFQSNWLTFTIGSKRWCLSPSRIYDPELGIFLQADILPTMSSAIQQTRGNPRALGVFGMTILANTFLKGFGDYKYSPYGKRTVLEADGSTVNTKSTYGQTRGFTGYSFDEDTGLYYARARMYSPGLGRFAGRDAAGYKDGYGLYRAYFIPNSTDPTGLWTWGITQPYFDTSCVECPLKHKDCYWRTTLTASPEKSVVPAFEYTNAAGQRRACSRTPDNIDRTNKHEDFHMQQAKDIAAAVDALFPKVCSTKPVCDKDVTAALKEATRRWDAAPEPNIPTKTPQEEAAESEAAHLCKDTL
jgi:RHS repeat-associated protein